jgi:hypothetical protein
MISALSKKGCIVLVEHGYGPRYELTQRGNDLAEAEIKRQAEAKALYEAERKQMVANTEEFRGRVAPLVGQITDLMDEIDKISDEYTALAGPAEFLRELTVFRTRSQRFLNAEVK